jgi:hypothetical protein
MSPSVTTTATRHIRLGQIEDMENMVGAERVK